MHGRRRPRHWVISVQEGQMHTPPLRAGALPDANRVAWPTGTAAVLGGVLLAVFYVAHAARTEGILEGTPGPFWLAMFFIEALGLLLLMLSVLGWGAPLATLSPASATGVVLL